MEKTIESITMVSNFYFTNKTLWGPFCIQYSWVKTFSRTNCHCDSCKYFEVMSISTFLHWLGHCNILMFWSEPFRCTSSCMFRVVILLDGEPPLESQVFIFIQSLQCPLVQKIQHLVMQTAATNIRKRKDRSQVNSNMNDLCNKINHEMSSFLNILQSEVVWCGRTWPAWIESWTELNWTELELRQWVRLFCPTSVSDPTNTILEEWSKFPSKLPNLAENLPTKVKNCLASYRMAS